MSFRRSVGYAWQGLRHAYRFERNFRIHLAIAAVVVLAGFLFRISTSHWSFLLMAISAVLTLEIVNTVFEKLIDEIHPHTNEMIGVVKDLMAAAVLVASLAAALVGALIFIPRLITL